MTPNSSEARESLAPRLREDRQAGGSRSVVEATADTTPQVPGRLDTYRSRSSRWHRQVRVDRCPRCGHPHLHRAPLAIVETVLKLAPCGAEYVVVLRPETEAA